LGRLAAIEPPFELEIDGNYFLPIGTIKNHLNLPATGA
jgi:hypothetical protein